MTDLTSPSHLLQWSLLILQRSIFLQLACVIAQLLAMLSGISTMQFMVGGHKGWTSNVNYTESAKTQHFYIIIGDYLS
ncbi:hypothetical protein Syun_023388 [Stephania yunnanensis]|uniref:Uncharacterized protein n=1 Tax=Stephania yunnanensis TaxID=152371 RepID=A0AAP0FC34_9MAGN